MSGGGQSISKLLLTDLQTCRQRIGQINNIIHNIKVDKMAALFDHETEEEDDRVDAIITKVFSQRKSMQSDIDSQIQKGKKKIDKDIKKRMKKKYLKF